MTKPAENIEQRQKRLRDREISDLKFVLKNPEGRRLLWRVLENSGIFLTSYVHGDNGYATTYNEGRRNIGNWIFSEILDANPEAFTQMQLEHQSEKKRDDDILKAQVSDKAEDVLV